MGEPPVLFRFWVEGQVFKTFHIKSIYNIGWEHSAKRSAQTIGGLSICTISRWHLHATIQHLSLKCSQPSLTSVSCNHQTSGWREWSPWYLYRRVLITILIWRLPRPNLRNSCVSSYLPWVKCLKISFNYSWILISFMVLKLVLPLNVPPWYRKWRNHWIHRSSHCHRMSSRGVEKS